MSLIIPGRGRTVNPSAQGWPIGPAQPQNQVGINRPQNPYTLSPQQTDAQYNYNQASAYQQADPRFAGKRYQRAGLSSSKGTASMGASDSANAYSQGMAAAEAGRMQDAYGNAGLQLADADSRSRFGLALTGLQEDQAQQDYMNQLRSQQNAMGFMGNILSPGGGGGSSLLSGLL